MHVDEVDYHNTAHISQPQLTGDFLGSFFVHLQCILFLVFFACSTVTAIHVDNVQCFGVLYNKVGTARQS
jgi:hypothetical protein